MYICIYVCKYVNMIFIYKIMKHSDECYEANM